MKLVRIFSYHPLHCRYNGKAYMISLLNVYCVYIIKLQDLLIDIPFIAENKAWDGECWLI